jgi:hypothetical protein
MMAECLLFSAPMQALAAAPGGPGALLLALLDLVEGRGGDDITVPRRAAVAYLIGCGEAPHCAAALEGWIAPLLSAKAPLDPRDPQVEPRLLERLSRRLRRADGRWIGGEAARRALEARRKQARQTALRGLGLESAADAFGRRR